MKLLILLILITTQQMFAQTKISGALSLDGDGDYVKIDDDPLLRLEEGDYTIEVIVKLDSYNSWWESSILSKRGDLPREGYIYSVSGAPHSPAERFRAHCAIAGGLDPKIFGAKTIELNRFYHIAFIYHKHAEMISIYINGEFDGSVLGYPNPIPGVEEELYIGSDPRGGLYFLDGILDEIRIWSVARSPKEIRQNMQSELPESVYKNPSGGLIAYYKFNEPENLGIGDDGLSDDIRDYSPNGFHGDLIGDAHIK